MASIVDLPTDSCLYYTGSLAKLSSNPMFRELRAALAPECNKASSQFQAAKHDKELKSVVETLDTPTFCHSDTLDPSFTAVQEASLQSEFRQITHHPKVLELQTFYYSNIADIEKERAAAITSLKTSRSIHLQKEMLSVHNHFDRKRVHLISRVTSSLQLLKQTIPPSDVSSQKDCSQGKMRSRQLSPRAVQIMTQWYEQHLHNPYPSDDEKVKMAEEGGISLSQVKAWFANKRNRSANTKPKRQKMQVEQSLMSICSELSGSEKTPRMYGDIIQQLSDIVNRSNMFSTDQIDLESL
ncbi:pre-B-cell leukemia transcription factor 4-like [Haliotis cracherodii]|uniref:pre-B-cell leukemia transcription factor 4-like n=1 Tax=Haliotis cracherodii TaxID=6455 RepID=UPI0039EA9B1C